MKRFCVVVFALLFLGTSAAVAQDVRYNYAQDVDFSKFKTYKWVIIKNADQADPAAAKQLTDAIDAELAKKGLTKTGSDTADLYVGYQTATGTEKELSAYGIAWGYGPGWSGGWIGETWRMGSESVTTSSVYPGQLDLDIYNSARKELVWRGIVSKTLDAKTKPDKRQETIEKSVAKLLKNYPPPLKKPE